MAVWNGNINISITIILVKCTKQHMLAICIGGGEGGGDIAKNA
jgi:hypothetical protein